MSLQMLVSLAGTFRKAPRVAMGRDPVRRRQTMKLYMRRRRRAARAIVAGQRK